MRAIALILLLGGCDVVGQDCGESLCGCWEATTLEVEFTVYNPQLDEPVQDAAVYCDAETEPVASSDADGLVSFAVETEQSPGCGYLRCGQLTVDASDQGLEARTLTVYEADGQQVDLQYMPD